MARDIIEEVSLELILFDLITADQDNNNNFVFKQKVRNWGLFLNLTAELKRTY